MKMEFTNFDELRREVHGLKAVPTAVIDADERHVLEGACEAAAEGLIEPTLIGDKDVIAKLLGNIKCKNNFASSMPAMTIP
jgi:phosphotransacetylase